MTDEQKRQILILREKGNGYKKIAVALELSESTVKSFCRRTQSVVFRCHCCGKEVEQTPGRKLKKFCSDACRMKWWNRNLDKVNRKAIYTFICPTCQKQFEVYGNAGRKYCSHECYVEARFGGTKL